MQSTTIPNNPIKHFNHTQLTVLMDTLVGLNEKGKCNRLVEDTQSLLKAALYPEAANKPQLKTQFSRLKAQYSDLLKQEDAKQFELILLNMQENLEWLVGQNFVVDNKKKENIEASLDYYESIKINKPETLIINRKAESEKNSLDYHYGVINNYIKTNQFVEADAAYSIAMDDLYNKAVILNHPNPDHVAELQHLHIFMLYKQAYYIENEQRKMELFIQGLHAYRNANSICQDKNYIIARSMLFYFLQTYRDELQKNTPETNNILTKMQALLDDKQLLRVGAFEDEAEAVIKDLFLYQAIIEFYENNNYLLNKNIHPCIEKLRSIPERVNNHFSLYCQGEAIRKAVINYYFQLTVNNYKIQAELFIKNHHLSLAHQFATGILQVVKEMEDKIEEDVLQQAKRSVADIYQACTDYLDSTIEEVLNEALTFAKEENYEEALAMLDYFYKTSDVLSATDNMHDKIKDIQYRIIKNKINIHMMMSINSRDHNRVAFCYNEIIDLYLVIASEADDDMSQTVEELQYTFLDFLNRCLSNNTDEEYKEFLERNIVIVNDNIQQYFNPRQEVFYQGNNSQLFSSGNKRKFSGDENENDNKDGCYKKPKKQ